MIVAPIKTMEVVDWCLHKHYAKRVPSITYAFGLFHNGVLVGVVSYGTPASSTLLRGVAVDEYSGNVVELNRLCINDFTGKNSASILVGRSMKALPLPTIVVSYADTSQGHIGYVYQATNFYYTGLSSKFSDPKVKGLEHQHHATYAHGKTNDQLKKEYGDRLYFEQRARKHRYIFIVGTKKQKKEILKKMNYPILPYPKGEPRKYNADYQPVTQGHLFV